MSSKKKSKQFCMHHHDTFLCGRDGSGRCRICVRKYQRKHYISHPKVYNPICSNGHNKDIVGKFKDGHCKECSKNKSRVYRKIHGDRVLKTQQNYHLLHKDRVIAYREKTKEKRKEYNSKYRIARLKDDPIFKLNLYLRNRLNRAIENNAKKGSAVRDLGCSIGFFKKYIEKKFNSRMTWNNWGKYWQLDHIKELWEFDLKDRKQLLRAVNYKNLQPLTIPHHKKKTKRNWTKHVAKRKNEK